MKSSFSPLPVFLKLLPSPSAYHYSSVLTVDNRSTIQKRDVKELATEKIWRRNVGETIAHNSLNRLLCGIWNSVTLSLQPIYLQFTDQAHTSHLLKYYSIFHYLRLSISLMTIKSEIYWPRIKRDEFQKRTEIFSISSFSVRKEMHMRCVSWNFTVEIIIVN